MRHTRDVTEEAALPSQNSGAGRHRLSHKLLRRTGGRKHSLATFGTFRNAPPFSSPGDMWARAMVCAALLAALWPAGRTEAERDERDVQNYSSSNRLVRLDERVDRLYRSNFIKSYQITLGFFRNYTPSLTSMQ